LEPPDKREFDVRPDENGMVQFQFRNQAWPDILKWLSDVSSMSLDWQELPSDYLNLATHRKFTLEDTRDIVNRHLLARGFTLLEFDNTLLVAKTAGINVSLVPKVEADALASLPPNRFVRISLPLESLVAGDVLAELKTLISSNGALSALSSTNRLEAMDSAGNLQELVRILQEEQSEQALDALAREFPLQHVRAADARDQLSSFLKLDSAKSSPAMSKDPNMRQQQMMMQQQQMMMQQQQQQQQQQAGGQPPKPKTEIMLVANLRRNSLIVHAPPNQMAIIASFVKRIDVAGAADSLNVLNTRMKVYRLSSLDPEKLVSSLLSLDALEPTTKLEVDEKNKAIIAYASLSDQLVIQQTIQRLDGSARQFDVIPLRRLRAEDVAGTVRALLGIDKDKKDNSSRSRYMYFDPWGQSDSKDASDDQLRIGANTQNNQLLIWANEMEREEIHKLLVKLGEIPPDSAQARRTRTIDANRSRETLEYLKQLEAQWGKGAKNPLVIPDESEFDPPVQTPGVTPAKPNEDPPKTKPPALEDISHSDVNQSTRESATIDRIALVGTTNSAEQPPEEQEESPSPIRIRFDLDGNLILESSDTEALDRLERLMTDRAPPAKKHVVYYIEHSRPSWIKINLEDYFKEDKKERGGDDRLFGFIFGFDTPEREDNSSPQLGKQRKLRFISDNDTKSLVVIGADASQQETIARLIKLWDVESPEDKQSLRYTNVVKIEHSRAESIVEAIKDAFRDLLSSNDKALEKPAPDANKESKRDNSSESIGTGGGMSFTFSGRLSLGIDRVTNSVIVSAKGEDLLKLVCKLITDLDEAAMPNGTVQSIKLNGANPTALEKALRTMMRANQELPPGQQQPQPPGQEQVPGQRGGRRNAPNNGVPGQFQGGQAVQINQGG